MIVNSSYVYSDLENNIHKVITPGMPDMFIRDFPRSNSMQNVFRGDKPHHLDWNAITGYRTLKREPEIIKIDSLKYIFSRKSIKYKSLKEVRVLLEDVYDIDTQKIKNGLKKTAIVYDYSLIVKYYCGNKSPKIVKEKPGMFIQLTYNDLMHPSNINYYRALYDESYICVAFPKINT